MKNQLLIGGVAGLILGWFLFRKKCPDCGTLNTGATNYPPNPYIIPNVYVPPTTLPPTTLPPTTLPPTTLPPTTLPPSVPIINSKGLTTSTTGFTGEGTFAPLYKRKYLV